MEAQTTLENLTSQSSSIEDKKNEILTCCNRLLASAGLRSNDSNKGSEKFSEALASLRSQSHWYERFDPLYLTLEDYAALTEHSLCEAILNDPVLKAMLPELYALRACYEADLEWDRARETLAATDAPALIRRQVDHKINSLPDAFYDALTSKQNILMAGSGPLPTTAMALVNRLKRPVVCLDLDEQANRLGAEYAAAGGYGDKIDFVTADLACFERSADFDAIVGAFLIGVGTKPEPTSAKTDTIQTLLNRIDPATTVILRTPQGLGALIYPPLNFTSHDTLQFALYPDRLNGRQPYDSTFAVLRRQHI